MTLEENNSARLLHALMDEQLDAVFLRQGAANSDDIKLHRLKSEPMLIVLPAGHPAARHETVALETLRDDALILTPRQVGPTHFDIVVAACRAAGFEPVMGQSAPQLGSVINFVAAELGFSLVPAAMAQLQVNGVVYRKVAGDIPMAHLALAYRSNDISTVLRNFVSRTLNAHHNAETEPTG
jgi:DNA-binding transcriptional LysR family regulator